MRTTAAPQIMLTMFLSIHSAIFIDWTPRGKAQQWILLWKVLEPLSQVLHSGRDAGFPRLIVHFDNAAPYRSAVTEHCFQSWQFQHVPQPPDSPDISPCHFFRFSDLKMELKGEEVESMKEVQDRAKE
jgi:hypothetical protein